mgnify:CR=1 FL=1
MAFKTNWYQARAQSQLWQQREQKLLENDQLKNLLTTTQVRHGDLDLVASLPIYIMVDGIDEGKPGKPARINYKPATKLFETFLSYWKSKVSVIDFKVTVSVFVFMSLSLSLSVQLINNLSMRL